MLKTVFAFGAVLATAVAAAGPLQINAYPSTLYPHALDSQRGVQSLILQNLGLVNAAGQPVTIDTVTIELLNRGVAVDTRVLGAAAIERAAKGGKAVQASGGMTLYAFQFGSVLGMPAAPLAGGASLAPGEGLLITQQVFAYNGARDEVRVTVAGTAAGLAVREVRQLPVMNTKSAITYQFPLKGGNWFVGAGASLHTAHRWAVPEEFALDIMRFGDSGAGTHHGDGSKRADYYAYRAPVHAAAPGKVVAVTGTFDEDETMFRAAGESATGYIQRIIAIQDKQMAMGPARAAGNYVIIEHSPDEYSMYAHLRPGSIKVAVGATVAAGQQIGELGTSGMSTEPHLHFQVCNKPDPVHCAGIPVHFSNVTLPYADFPRALQSGDVVIAQ
jgi:murein DD-endopeptidase MepM/ murein hydrolase activator NlpD